MKKVERLQLVEAQFGREYVLPYRLCLTWEEVVAAITKFERAGHTWGMRTDTPDGTHQGFLLPFILHGTRARARQLVRKHGQRLLYIVSHNITRYLCNGVALLVDPEHIYIEYADSNPKLPQRLMYSKAAGGVKQIGIGFSSYLPVRIGDFVVRCFKPHEVRRYRFDEVYYLIVTKGVREVTFSVRAGDRRLVIW